MRSGFYISYFYFENRMTRIKLGIIQVNHDKTIEVGDAFPDDAHRFRDLFDLQDERFSYRVYMTIGGELPQDVNEQDAYLITGSPLSVLDEHIFSDGLSDFIRQCDAAKKPLFGACFGHQAIAVALGGKVERTQAGYNVGIEETRFNSMRPWMMPQRNRLRLYVFHEDQVTQLPPQCDLLGSSDNCKIASFAKENHIFTTQAHPEFNDPFMNGVLNYCESSIDPKVVSRARSSMLLEQEGGVFAQWCTRFFQGAVHA